MKNLIREVAPEHANLLYYFDGDTYTERAGDYCNNLFIVSFDHGRVYGFNQDEYERLQSLATDVADQFTDVMDGYLSCTFRDVMNDCGIEYSPTKCHKLKEWAHYQSPDDTAGIAAFLTIITGRQWDVCSVRGYSQGDYAELIYCPDFYKNGVEIEGEIYLGCAKEFSVTEYDDNGNENHTCYGYIVADSQVRTDEDYKRIVCEYADINPEDTTLEMIDSSRTYTEYTYRAV